MFIILGTQAIVLMLQLPKDYPPTMKERTIQN